MVSGRLQLGRDELDVSRHAPRTIVRHICDPEDIHLKPPTTALVSSGSCPNRHNRSAIWRVYLRIPHQIVFTFHRSVSTSRFALTLPLSPGKLSHALDTVHCASRFS